MTRGRKMNDKMNNQENSTKSIFEHCGSFCTDQSLRRTLAILSVLACSFGLAALSLAGPANISPAVPEGAKAQVHAHSLH
jgi:hypothetical protein